MRRFAAIVLLALAAFGAACSGSSYASPTATPSTATATVVPPVAFSTTQLRIEGPGAVGTIDVDVATTEAQSERGLGYRDALAPDAGMIFDLHQTRRTEFWMKGMRFALDMVWIDADKRVAGVTADVQPQPDAPDDQLRRYSSDVPVRYVLELNAGAAARLGIAAGTQLGFTLP